MVFSGTMFLFCFLPVTLVLYFLAPKALKNYILIIASLIFYAWGEPVFVVLILLSSFIDYLAGLLVAYSGKKGRSKSRVFFLCVSIIMNVGLLGFFKYADFIIASINAALGTAIPMTGVALPIGISFYTFQTMSYTIDVYRGRVEAQKSFLNLLLYTTLFPQLVAGPIVRYSTIAHQINERSLTLSGFSDGVLRFTIGLGKKMLIANRVAIVADYIFSRPAGDMAVMTAWLGIFAYTLQIYYDFSGYSDMAIGLGKMFGFDFEENFDYPYVSCSITEFWRRWHISLGSWFRDYVYFPMGGSRVKKPRLIFNLFVVWALTGLWHGAAWTFVAWGLFFFVLLSIEKLTGLGAKKGYSPIRNLYTFILVMVGFVLFRSPDLTYSAQYLLNMFGAGQTPFTDLNTSYYFFSRLPELALGALFALPVLKWCKKLYASIKSRPVRGALDAAQAVFCVGVYVASVVYLINESYNPFIYFRF